MTMMKFEKYSAELLESTWERISETLSEEDWRDSILKKASKILKNNPRQYRAYGPYWWGFKKLINAAGYINLGDNFEGDVGQLYELPRHVLLSSLMYAEGVINDGGNVYSSEHILMSDGEPLRYVLADIDLEAKALDFTVMPKYRALEPG